MAAIVGFKGLVKLGANTVANLNSWDLPIQADVYEVTPFNTNAAKTYIAGLLSADIKASGFYDNTDTNGQIALQNAILNGTSVSLSLYVNATNHYDCTAFVKGMDIKTPVSGPVTVDFSLQSSGAISYT